VAPGRVELPTFGLGNLQHPLKAKQILPLSLQIPAKSCKIRNPDATKRNRKRGIDSMALDFGDGRDTQDDITGQAFAAPLAPTELSRADIADYLARSNYDAGKAKVLATQETVVVQFEIHRGSK
jgi:hypothetical protein